MQLRFKPATKDFNDLLDSGYLRSLWQKIGSSYILAAQKVTGLSFNCEGIVVRCGKLEHTMSGLSGSQAIQIATHHKRSDDEFEHLRMSDDGLIGSLTHELGHRLLERNGIFIPTSVILGHDYEAHRLIYLFLYDSWVLAFGKYKADGIAKYDTDKFSIPGYKEAWDWAMSLSPSERAGLTRYLVRNKRLPKVGEAL